jgi:putative DNA primase/helicase
MDVSAKIKAVAAAALEAAEVLLSEWLPEGQRQGGEWVSANPVRGDRRAGSFGVSLVSGRWNDFADSDAKGGDLVSLLAYLRGTSQLSAARLIDAHLRLGLFNGSAAQVATVADEARKAAAVRRRQSATEQQRAQATASKRARTMWKSAQAAESRHPYLTSKHIPALSLRQAAGELLVPIFNGRELVNLQRIAANGEKRFLPGGRVRGCYAPIGKLKPETPLYICEGWATGVVLHLHTGAPVACAMNAGNLIHVADALRDRHGNTIELIVAGDDDRKTSGNPGRTAALEAAKATGALVIFPDWPEGAANYLSDFNDLHVWLQTQKEADNGQVQAAI